MIFEREINFPIGCYKHCNEEDMILILNAEMMSDNKDNVQNENASSCLCPVCEVLILKSDLKYTALFPSPYTTSEKNPFTIVIRPTDGTFLQ